MPVNEYYTTMKSLWEEVESMNILPVVLTPIEEVKKLLEAIDLQREESKPFQFLIGVDEIYNPQRSQLLMMVPLPSVDVACSVLMQDEAQRDILQIDKNDDNVMAMFGRTSQPRP